MSFCFPICVTSSRLESIAVLVRVSCQMLSSLKATGVYAVRREFRVWLVGVVTAGFLTGCALSPQGDQERQQRDDLLKEQSADALSDDAACACDPPDASNHFDAAMQMLAMGEFDAARTSMAQHADSGGDQAAQEASAGLDLIEAIAAQDIEPEATGGPPENARGSVLRLLLALIADLQDQIAQAQADNAQLSVELDKREDALKRLRELTLGQPEA